MRRTIGLGTSSQMPFLEWHEATGRWRVWLMYENNLNSGTFMDLYSTGAVDRVTIKDLEIADIRRVRDTK